MDNHYDEEDLDGHLQLLKEIKDPQEAIAILKEHQSNGTLNDALFFYYLELLLDQQEYEQALKLLTIQKCRELSDPESFLIRAKILSQLKKRTPSLCDEVEYLCLEALRLDARHLDAFRVLLEWYALVFQSSNKISFLFKLAQSSQVGQLDFYKEMLSALLMINEEREAIQVYDALMELLPSRERPVFDFIRILHLQLHQTGKARMLWDIFRKRGSADHPSVYTKIRKICEQLIDDPLLWDQECSSNQQKSTWDEALKINTEGIREKIDLMLLHCFDRLEELSPKDIEVLHDKGCFLLNHDPQNASACFQKVLAIASDYLPAKYQHACLLKQMGQHVEAHEAFQEIVQSSIVHPDIFTETYLQLHSLCLDSNQLEKSAFYLEQALSLAPANPKIHFALGQLYLEEYALSLSKKSLNKADDHFHRILALSRECPEAYYYLAQTAYAKEQYFSSINLLKDAQRNMPSQDRIYFWLSRAFYGLHQNMPSPTEDYLAQAVACAEKISPSGIHAFALFRFLKKLYVLQNKKGHVADMEKKMETHAISDVFKEIDLRAIEETGCTQSYLLSREGVFSTLHPLQLKSYRVKGDEKFYLKGLKDNASEKMHDIAHTAFVYAQQYLTREDLGHLFNNKDLIIECSGNVSSVDAHSASFSLIVSMMSALLGMPVPKDMVFIGGMTPSGEILPARAVGKKIELAFKQKASFIFVPLSNHEEILSVILEGKIDAILTPKLSSIIFVEHVSEILDALFKT